jgi:PKD domain
MKREGAQVEDQGWPIARMRRSSELVVCLLAALALSVALTFASDARAERLSSLAGFGYARIHSACQAPGPGYASCFALVRTPASSAEAARPGVMRFSLRDGAASAGPAGGLTPAQLAGAYGYELSAVPASEQTIAIVDAFDDPKIGSDLTAFDTEYGLAPCTEANKCFRKVSQTGKASPLPAADTSGWSVEISLDVEVAHAACQHCRILLVEAENAQFNNLGAAVNEAVTLGANEVSNSYGGPEGLSGEEAAYNHPGVVIAAATGDEGYNGWLEEGEFPDRPNLPASLSTVVAVGGTTLALNESGERAAETVWNGNGVEDFGKFAHGATGGGCSGIFPAKPWQLAVAGFGATGCGSKRSVGDVAAVADPRTGFDIFDSYNCGAACEAFKSKGTKWLTIGGTSLSTPLISALYALAGGSNGVSYPALTPYGHLGESSALYDVREGGNGYCDDHGLACGIDGELEEFLEVSPFRVDCEGTTSCNAAVGFDGPSGVGAPSSLALFKPLRPTAVISPPAKLLAGSPAAFSGAQSSDPYPGGTPLVYHWAWGDGATSTGPAPSHVFAAPGEYHVTLSVTDAYGIESVAVQGGVEVAERTAKEIEEELAAKKKAEEEAAGKKKAEEELAAKKKAEEEAFARAVAELSARRHSEEEAAGSARGQVGVAGSKTAADPAATLAQTALAVSRSGAVTLLVTCPATETSCTGTTTLRSLGARGRILVLTGGSFTVAGGGEKKVVLRLSKSARALLRRLGRLRAHATILAHDPAGVHHTTILLVTLRGVRRT